MAGFGDGGGAVAVRVVGGGGILTGWTTSTCIMGAPTPYGAWFGGTQRFGSTVGPYPGGEVAFKEVRFGALSETMSSAMSAAIWLTVPFNVVKSHSTVTMRAPSVEMHGAWASALGQVAELLPSVPGVRLQGLVVAVHESWAVE
ncbi:hypothetical protein CDL15_Pgr017649 [Punica granatum]|uniref:Uncharacterized protein n=1 Tax=Punica granatum TaxID=22663 RepID=A0A218XQ56_PUNGR|nr:hypothetical protein CDL15_Pgr017649 [Punica granatum]